MWFLYQLIELIKPRLLTVNFTVKTAVSAIAAITSVVAIQVAVLVTVVKHKTHLITNY